MITDPLFYRLFETSPETFFLLGMSAESARDMAARYQYQAIEFKETAHRVDGVLLDVGLIRRFYLDEMPVARTRTEISDPACGPI